MASSKQLDDERERNEVLVLADRLEAAGDPRGPLLALERRSARACASCPSAA